jgi:hypothetical protein
METLAVHELEFGPWVNAGRAFAPAKQRTTSAEAFTPPLDVREWVSPARLERWSLDEAEALEECDDVNPAERWPSAAEPNPKKKLLLRLLAYAYACRVFDSEGIVHKCCFDPNFRNLCAAQPPSPRELWRFRRAHRPALERVLSRLLLRSVQERFGLDAAIAQPGLEEDLRHRAIERLNIARHMDQP